MTDLTTLIVELWPYAADGKYDRRLKMLRDDAAATRFAGVDESQIVAGVEEIARRHTAFLTAAAAMHGKFADLRESERVRKQEGPHRYARSAEPTMDGTPVPWRACNMTMPEWLDAEGEAAFDTLEGCFGDETVEAVRSLHGRGKLGRSDSANAVKVGQERAMLTRGKPCLTAG